MHRKATILILFFFLLFDLNAQNIESISGNIQIDSSEQAYGNAIVLSPVDSSLITGTTFWDGQFEIMEINQPAILLQLSSLEFEDVYINLAYKGESSIDLGAIKVQVEQNKLDELIVTAEKPLTINRADGSMEIKIENTALSTSTSVDEILSRSPTVVSNEDGDFEIVGKGRAVIYVNGKRVNNARLSTISPSEIKSIQILSNPGPKYDAEGNAVIDIVTTSKSDQGFNGSLKNYYTINEFAGNSNRSNLHLSSAKNKWSINGDYGLQLGNTRHILRTTRTRNIPDDYFHSDLKTDWQYEDENYSNYSLGIQYEPKPNTYVSLEYSGAYEKMGGQQTSDNAITSSESGFYQSQIDVDRLDLKNTFNANLSFQLDTTSSIFLGSQYSNFEQDFENLINNNSQTESTSELSSIQNTGSNQTRLISNQVDYQKRFSSFSLEAGAKYWYVDVASGTDFLDVLEDGSTLQNDELSNYFNYTEKVSAGYFVINGKSRNNTKYSIGLRAENTQFKLESSAGDGTLIDRQYVNFFPSASLTKTLFNGFESFLTFSSRINRPSYSRLNPFVIYQDQFTSIQGNPNLVPSRVYSFELGTIKDGWNLKLAYNHTLDILMGGAFQSGEDSRVYVLQRYNMSQERSFLFSLSKNIKVGPWQSVNTMSVTSSRLIDENEAFEVREQRPFLYFYTQQKFDVLDLFKVYITGSYRSNKRDGIYYRRSSGFLNTGVEMNFLKDQMKINLEFSDILYTVRADGEYQIGETYIIFANQYSSSYFRGSLTFNFGKSFKSKFKNKKVGESEIRRAN